MKLVKIERRVDLRRMVRNGAKKKGSAEVRVWRNQVDLFSPEDRRAVILRALKAENRPMGIGDIRGWALSHTDMYLSESAFTANVRVLMRKGKIIVDRTTQEFSLVK